MSSDGFLIHPEENNEEMIYGKTIGKASLGKILRKSFSLA